MSLTQPNNETKATFFPKVNDGTYRPVQVLWIDSAGTAIWCKLRDDSDLVILVTDATAPIRFPSATFRIEKMGQTSVTLPINSLSGTTVQALSPALSDTVLTNWRVLGTVRPGAVRVVSVEFTFVSISSLAVVVRRASNLTGASSPGATDASATYPSDTQIDVGLGHAHAGDAGASTTHTHPVTGTHTHTLPSTDAQIIVLVDWMILHV